MLILPVVHRWLEDASSDPVRFWARAARQLPWFRTWDRTFEWNFPTFRWFIGGETNLAYNALDHHVERGCGGQTALIYLNERGERGLFTYASLLHHVERVAAALRALGLGKGDRLTIYMPTCPEAIVLMLATVRIGAIHSVVFAGFGARALGDRIVASGSRAVFTADVTYRKGKEIALKPIVDEALASASHSVKHLVTLERVANAGPAETGHYVRRERDGYREMTWDAFVTGGQGHS